jgi:hypothetical protein
VRLGTTACLAVGSRRSARSRSTAESISLLLLLLLKKMVSAISGCSSASMMMTALSAFNHWPFKVSPSRIASRTRSAKWVVERSMAEASGSHSWFEL